MMCTNTNLHSTFSWNVDLQLAVDLSDRSSRDSQALIISFTSEGDVKLFQINMFIIKSETWNVDHKSKIQIIQMTTK